MLVRSVPLVAQNAPVALEEVFAALPVVEVLGAEYSVAILGEERLDCSVAISSVEPERIHLLETDDRLRIRIEQPEPAATHRLPRGAIELRLPASTDIIVQTSAGSVLVTDLAAPRGVQIRSAAGSVGIRNVSTDEIYISTASGDLDAAGVVGRVTLRSAGGTVRLSNAQGRFSVRTASGNQLIEETAGPLTATSASGSIRLVNTTGSHRISSSAGAIVAEAMLPAGENEFETVSGSVTLDIATPASDLQLIGRSLHGEVVIGEQTGFDLMVGSGRTVVSMKSTTGRLTAILGGQ